MGSKVPKELQGHEFKPHQSGNPGGKTKQQRAFEKQFAKVVNEMQVTLKDKKGKAIRTLPCVEALTRKLIELAIDKEQGWAFRLAFHYIFGDNFNLSVYLQHAGEIKTGPEIIDIAELLSGFKLSAKTIEKIRNRYLEVMFPGRGFSGEDEIAPS